MSIKSFSRIAFVSLTALGIASCATPNCGDCGLASAKETAQVAQPGAAASAPAFVAGTAVNGDFGPFAVASHATLNKPWALALEPGTGTVFITEKPGTMKFVKSDGTAGSVTGMPAVDYGPGPFDQDGLGDFAFAPDYASSKTVYLSWAEAGADETRGAALGRGILNCAADSCAIEGLSVIWRQSLKVGSRGHYSHRIAFSPDGQYLFVSSGDRQQGAPAQDLSDNLGSVVRLNLDGTPASGNPFADQAGARADIWSYGHRNLLGLQFSPDGRLWDLEHGPAGGDELNLVKPGRNYGWPVVSDGDDYDGTPIPAHSTRPDLAAPAISWNPVIAPGDFIFYTGDAFPQWQGQVLIAGLKTQAIIRVRIEGENAVEMERFDFGKRLRDLAQAADGSLWVIEDGAGGRLLHLTPKR